MTTEERLARLEEVGHAHCLEAVMLRGPQEDELRAYLALHEGQDTKHTRRAARALDRLLHPRTPVKNKSKTRRAKA